MHTIESTTQFPIWIQTGSESIEATIRRRRILFAGFVARMEDTRLLKRVMFGEVVRGAGCVGGQEKGWMPLRCLKKNLNASRPSQYPSVRGENVSKRLGGIIGCKD